jgi:hypothetical protein
MHDVVRRSHAHARRQRICLLGIEDLQLRAHVRDHRTET